MKCSLDISNFLEEISGLSYSIVFLSFFALFTLFSLQVMSDSFATPWAVALQAPLSTGFPGKNTGSSCHFLLQDCSLRKAFLSLLVILWNSVFRWVYLSFSPLPSASLLFSAVCKVSSNNHFAFLHFFFLGMVLISSCTRLQTSIHSSSGSLFIRSNLLNLFVISTA